MQVTRPLRVILVEDSAVLRDRLTESLAAQSGVEIIGSADTEEAAVQKLRETDCDVVVLDLQLKRGNGFNVLKAIRQSESAEHKKTVIVLTNYAFSLYRHRCLQAGADFFLDKARDYERLPHILSALMEDRAALHH